MSRHDNAPWDRRRRVSKPDDYTPGLYRVHQLTAQWLLRLAVPWTQWEAEFLQVVAYQGRDLSSLQAYWMNRLEASVQQVAA